MIAFAIVIAILEGLIRLFDTSFRKQILSSTSVENSLELRRKLKRRRTIWSIVLIVLLCVLGLFLGGGAGIGIVLGYVLIKGVRAKFLGNVQYSNKEDYLKNYQKELVNQEHILPIHYVFFS